MLWMPINDLFFYKCNIYNRVHFHVKSVFSITLAHFLDFSINRKYNYLLEHQNYIACLQNVVTHPKHLIHASKPSYFVSKLANGTKIKKCFCHRVPHWSKIFFFFTMEIFVICKFYYISFRAICKLDFIICNFLFYFFVDRLFYAVQQWYPTMFLKIYMNMICPPN